MIYYEYEPLFRQNSVKKDFTITDGDSINIDNSDIYSESISLKESLCSEKTLIFGSCEAACFKFTTSDTADVFKDKKLSVMVSLDNHTSDPFLYGSYTVAEETLTADRKRKEIVAYDDIYVIHNTNVADYYNNLIYPVSLKTFRDGFFSFLNIPCEDTTLVNDNMMVEKTIDVPMLSGTDVIKAICEINGVFGHIDRQGVFRFISLLDTSVYSISTSMYSKVEHEDYDFQPITQLQIRMEENDIGVIVGVSGNSYIVEDNFLVYGKGTEELTPIANNLLSQIEGISYKPCKIDCIGNPCFEVGDRFTVTKKDNTTFSSYLLERNLKGLQALFDSIVAEGEEYYSEDVNGIHYEIQQLKGKSNVLERTIEETRSTISDVEAGLQSEIRQTAEGIEIQIADLQSQIDGETAYYERETGAPTLLNYPYWDFTTAIPCNNTIRTAPIYTENMGPDGEEYPHFYYSETDRKNHRSDITYVDDTNLAYRFVLENGIWFWREVADTEYTQVLSRLSRLEATAEELTSEYSELSLTLSNGYYTKVQTDSQIRQSASQIQITVAATYATQTETRNLQSQITQTAGSITSEVTRATNAEDQLSSRITQNADAITAKVSSSGGSSSSFAWELNTTNFRLISNNSEVFKCNSSGVIVKGTIESNNAKITGGSLDISASSGSSTVFRAKYGSQETYMTASEMRQKNGSYYAVLDALSGLTVYNNYGTTRVGGNTFQTPSVTADSIRTDNIYLKSSYGSLTISPNVVFQGNLETYSGKDVLLKGRIGFFGHSAVTRSTVTGSTDSAKLSSLITILKGYGLIG